MRMPPGDRMAWTLVLVGAAGAAALVVARGADREPDAVRAPEPREETERRAEVRRCADLDIPRDPPEPVTCRVTSGTTLTIVSQAKPLLLDGTQARVVDAVRAPAAVVVRLRLRNETGTPQRAGAGGQQTYLNVGGMRIDARPLPRTRIAVATGETIRFRFPLTAAQTRLLSRAGGRAELGVVPWREEDRTGDVRGVIRLRLTARA